MANRREEKSGDSVTWHLRAALWAVLWAALSCSKGLWARRKAEANLQSIGHISHSRVAFELATCRQRGAAAWDTQAQTKQKEEKRLSSCTCNQQTCTFVCSSPMRLANGEQQCSSLGELVSEECCTTVPKSRMKSSNGLPLSWLALASRPELRASH